MRHLEQVYMRTLRHIYDTEKQLVISMVMLSAKVADIRLLAAIRDIEAQSANQAQRLDAIFGVLYLEPRTEASWATTALLREAWDACGCDREGGTKGCSAALLAIKRYEITLYEALLRWSEDYDLKDAIPYIRRSVAEELLQASILSELAFERSGEHRVLDQTAQAALH